LFTGQRLPNTDVTESAGVEAAHILPWSTHNINAIPNGICLRKLCHWAFDAEVLKLSYDGSVSSFILSDIT
jgi:predicted restriction endonuclease